MEYDRAGRKELDRPSSETNQFSTDAFFMLLVGGLTLFFLKLKPNVYQK